MIGAERLTGVFFEKLKTVDTDTFDMGGMPVTVETEETNDTTTFALLGQSSNLGGAFNSAGGPSVTPRFGIDVFVASGFSAPEARALAISPDGKQVAAAAGSTVRVWETATGKEVPLTDSHWRAPAAIVLSPDGKTVVSWGFDRVIRRWDAATGKQLGAFPAPPRTTLAALSPDGETVALANRYGLTVVALAQPPR